MIPDNMDGKSLTPDQEKINALKNILPEVFCEDKIDWEKLKATLGANINFSNERYVLNWAGKSDAFRELQTPSTRTLLPAKEESIHFDQTENVFIEGENLEVLKLLQKSYFGKVKMIYIDPPYNTGNDSFIYPDKFSERKSDYEKRVGDKDEEGYRTKDGLFRKNSKENGQYHSNWLNMMMPRLYLAKNLLRQDGVIFVSIDDNEVHNLRLLMNEIFGEENFVANFLWKKKGTTSNVEGAQVSSLTDSTLCFRKSEKSLIKPRIIKKESRKYLNSDNEGNFRTTIIEKKDSGSYKRDTMKYKIIGHYPRAGKRWQIGKETAKLLEAKNRFIWDGEKIILKIYDFEDKDTTSAQPNLLFDHGTTDSAANDLKKLFNGIQDLFDNPKPIELIVELAKIITSNNDIILDFFAGSGTTAHAVMNLNKQDGGNRKYICVQLPERTDEKSEAYKAGYKTIADISKERIRRVITQIHDEQSELASQSTLTQKTLHRKKEELDDIITNGDNKLFDAELIDPKAQKLSDEIDKLSSKIEQIENQIEIIEQMDKGFKVFKLSDSNFKQWQEVVINDEQELATQLDIFVDPITEDATIEHMVYELLLKSGKELNSSIVHQDGYYLIDDNDMALLLESASQETIAAVININPKKVIALDRLFNGNDQLKTNTVLQMKDAGIEFKTI